MAARSHNVRSCRSSGIRSPSARNTCLTTCVGQQHQGQQAGRFSVAGQRAVHHASQADGFVGEVVPLQRRAAARDVALAEDQIQHVQHGIQARGTFLVGRHAEAHARRLDLFLRAADSLRHGRLGHQERARDLGGRQPAHCPQRQRNRRRPGQRRVTAHEQEQQRVVVLFDAVAVGRRHGWLAFHCLCDDLGLAPPPRQVGADCVGHAPRRDVNQPAAWVFGDALLRPLHGRGQQRLLHGVFGGREVTEAPHDGTENLRRQLAQQVLARENGVER